MDSRTPARMIALLAWLVPAAAIAEGFPLEQGRYWDFRRGFDGHVERRTIEGTRQIGDRTAVVLRWAQSGREDYLWRDPADGTVYQLGTKDHRPGWVRFDPPVLLWAGDVQVDDGWNTRFDPIHVAADGTETPDLPIHVSWTAKAFESVETPAGTFPAWKMERWEVHWEKRSQREYYVHDVWVAPGIGIVRVWSQPDEALIEELVAFGPTVGTRAESFGRLKARF